jgi:hypothetical protein
MPAKKKKVKGKKKMGRPSRQDLGLEPTIGKTVKVEQKVIDIIEENYGSLSNALRHLANQ